MGTGHGGVGHARTQPAPAGAGVQPDHVGAALLPDRPPAPPRAAIAVAWGAWTGVRTVRIPSLAARRTQFPPEVRSRSRMRNGGAVCPGVAWIPCCQPHGAVGGAVTAHGRMWRRSGLMQRKTDSVRTGSVGTVKKAQAPIAWAWSQRNERQVGDGADPSGRRERRPVATRAVRPRARSAPPMRGAPRVGAHARSAGGWPGSPYRDAGAPAAARPSGASPRPSPAARCGEGCPPHPFRSPQGPKPPVPIAPRRSASGSREHRDLVPHRQGLQDQILPGSSGQSQQSK